MPELSTRHDPGPTRQSRGHARPDARWRIAIRKPRGRHHRHAPRRASAILSLAGASAVAAAANATGALIATAVLGLHERGVMVLAVTVTGLVALVAGLGTGSALRSQLPPATQVAQQRLLAAYFWLCCATTAGAGALAALAVRASAPLIDTALADPRILWAVALCAAVQLLLQQFNDAWFAQGHFRRGGAWNAAATTGGLVALVATAVVVPHAWAILLAQGTGQLVVVGAQGVALHRRGTIVFGRPVWRDVMGLIRLGVPTLGFGVGLAFAMRADRYILGAVAGTAAVSVYSLAATLSETPRMLSGAFGQLTMRDVATRAAKARIGRSVIGAVLATIAVGLIVAVAGWFLLTWIFGPQFAPARAILILLLVAEVCFAPYAVASRGLLGGGWTGTAGLLGALGSIVALAGYAVAIPAAGMTGAAIVSGAVYLGLSGASLVWLRRRLRRIGAGPTTRAAVGAEAPAASTLEVAGRGQREP